MWNFLYCGNGQKLIFQVCQWKVSEPQLYALLFPHKKLLNLNLPVKHNDPSKHSVEFCQCHQQQDQPNQNR